MSAPIGNGEQSVQRELNTVIWETRSVVVSTTEQETMLKERQSLEGSPSTPDECAGCGARIQDRWDDLYPRNRCRHGAEMH